MDKLSFSARIRNAKNTIFTEICGEALEKGGNGRSGYYPIKTIMRIANKYFCEYGVDLDISIESESIVAIWHDDFSDSTRTSTYAVPDIKKIERLASMQNTVQSTGAVLTYYRRYGLTCALGLPATDLLENSPPKKQNKPTKPAQTDISNVPNPEPHENNYAEDRRITEKQLKLLFARMKGKLTEDQLKAWYLKRYGTVLESKKNLKNSELELILNKLDKMEVTQ